MARTSLPPGFRFHPTDVELIKYYLKRKVLGKKFRFEAIAEVNIYKFSPWDLPDKSCLQSKDREWYFFCPRERRYASGSRMSRTTETGFWKTTGKDRPVLYNEQNAGMIKTLVFHLGHAPLGERTDWVMHEYRIEDKDLADAGVVQDSYVLCKIFKKSGPGPKNGAQYGALFNEEEWDHDEEDGLFPQALEVPDNQNSSVVTSMLVQESMRTGSLSEPGPSNVVPQMAPTYDDIDAMLATFMEDSTFLSADANQIAIPDSLNRDKSVENEIFNGLGDLGNVAGLSGDRFDFSNNSEANNPVNSMFPTENVAFLELNDLDFPLSFHAEAYGSESFPTDNICISEFQNLFGCAESNHFPVNSFTALRHVSGPSISPIAAEGFNGHGDHFGLFQKGNDAGESSNQGWATTSRGF